MLASVLIEFVQRVSPLEKSFLLSSSRHSALSEAAVPVGVDASIAKLVLLALPCAWITRSPADKHAPRVPIAISFLGLILEIKGSCMSVSFYSVLPMKNAL